MKNQTNFTIYIFKPADNKKKIHLENSLITLFVSEAFIEVGNYIKIFST